VRAHRAARLCPMVPTWFRQAAGCVSWPGHGVGVTDRIVASAVLRATPIA
jgi:hypothetical protein